jgi:hypothetical protein
MILSNTCLILFGLILCTVLVSILTQNYNNTMYGNLLDLSERENPFDPKSERENPFDPKSERENPFDPKSPSTAAKIIGGGIRKTPRHRIFTPDFPPERTF